MLFSGIVCCFFFFKQKTAYEMRISDWSSDVCSSDLAGGLGTGSACGFVPFVFSNLHGETSRQHRGHRVAGAPAAPVVLWVRPIAHAGRREGAATVRRSRVVPRPGRGAPPLSLPPLRVIRWGDDITRAAATTPGAAGTGART